MSEKTDMREASADGVDNEELLEQGNRGSSGRR